MLEQKLSYTNADKTVVFGVRSKLMVFNDKACEQVWKVVERTDIKQGTFGLFVNRKIIGQSNITDAVKIVGPAPNSPHHLYLKFQTAPGECYEGSLSLRFNGGEMEYASRLRDMLKKVTGDGWFNLKSPEVKRIVPPLVPTVAPITRFDTALFTAATAVVMRRGASKSPSSSGKNVLVPITTAAARYKRLMNIRADIADLEAKKSNIEQRIAALNKKATKKILLDAEIAVRAAGVNLAKL